MGDTDALEARRRPRTLPATVGGAIRLLRPKQWVKNAFVFAPLVFTGRVRDADALYPVLLTCGLFCLASSIVYVLNDLADIEKDRRHPTKSKTRPLASGDVAPWQAWVIMAGLAAVLGLAGLRLPQVMAVIGGYVTLNVAYTLKLKQVPVVDIFCIAIGFVLRVYAGATAMAVPVSHWMFITTLCLALYLAAIKRRQELKNVGDQGRAVLGKYSISIVDRYAMLSSSGALVFYSMFVMSTRPGLMVTIPVVMFGLFRYWYLVDQLEEGESPTDVLFADAQILLTVVVWIVACAWVIAGGP